MKVWLTFFSLPLLLVAAIRRRRLPLALLACALVACFHPARILHAQSPGSVDPTFKPGTSGLAGTGVNSLALQSDGKIIIGGNFTTLNGVATNYARLNPDGTLDTAFNPSGGTNNDVYSVALQSDGKVLLGGYFTALNGAPRAQVARLNADGSLDMAFNPPGNLVTSFFSVAQQSDGKVLVGGGYIFYGGLYRLNKDGSLDPSFKTGTINRPVARVLPQVDGKILVGSSPSFAGGADFPSVARLNANGSLDSSILSQRYDNIRTLASQSDGKLLVGGDFNNVSTSKQYIARYNLPASSDFTFYPNSNTGGVPNGPVSAVAQQSDGKVLICGDFTTVGNVPRNRIARLNADGTLDATFNPGSGADGSVSDLVVQGDGKVLLGGRFTTVNGVPRKFMARLNTDGSLDTSFLNLDTTSLNPATGANASITRTALQRDGKLLMTGSFTTINGVARSRLARLNADGSLDASFDPGSGLDSFNSSLVVQSDGKVLLGESVTTINGFARSRPARLNTDGSLDASFDPGSGANNTVTSLVLQSDGKVLVGGSFTLVNGVTRNAVARLQADGSLDASFDPGTGASSVAALVLQSDGKMLVGGSFTSFNGMARKYLARLNADGSLDSSFDPGNNLGSSASRIALQSDGKVLVQGSVGNPLTSVGRIVRLNSDGSLDTSFNFNNDANGDISALVLQSDGKILLGGHFTAFGGVTRNHLARLNADGGLDISFNPGDGANNDVSTLAVQGDGKVIAGGYFTAFDGVGCAYVTRLYGGEAAPAAPSVLGNSADTLHATTTVVRANVAPLGATTNVSFQYGLTSTYGSTTAAQNIGAGTSPVAVSNTLSGLTPATLYHYRVVATNSVGTTYGDDATFTTLGFAQDWRQQYFNTTSNTGSAADGADPDGDSIVNLLERALGLDPKAAGRAGLPMMARDASTGRLMLTATKGAFSADLTFSAEASADLLTWTTSGVTVLTNTATTFQARDDNPAGSNRRFLRLRVTAP